MSRLCCLAAALALAAAPASAQDSAPAPAQDLAGLWAARKYFVPEVRGRLIIARTASGLSADIAGRIAPVTRNGPEVAFDLPGNQGAFSGRFEGPGVIRGHWIRPPSAISYGRSASPVVLTALGRDRWAGLVDPGEEQFSFYIFAKPRTDGSYAAVLRNPEFDLGNQRGVRRLVRDGDAVRLMVARGDSAEQSLAAGRIEPDGFSLFFPGRGGSYDFAR
ncbi:MAG TPA: hypothetical protein VF079_07530, partial [Sphingomicrobium sp.]